MAKPPAARRALLDVDVLIALLDSAHVHHARASAWLGQHIDAGWASCAVTQNGCIRILAQPSYANAVPAAEAARRLRAATETRHHRFIPDNPSLLDRERFDVGQLLGHRQITDAWLLGLAVEHHLRFVTFDSALPWRAVKGATPGHAVQL